MTSKIYQEHTNNYNTSTRNKSDTHSFHNMATFLVFTVFKITIICKPKSKLSQSHVMTDAQNVEVLSPLWDLWPDITFYLKVALSLRGALSDERSGLSFVILSL
jgi:hypothetical protein